LTLLCCKKLWSFLMRSLCLCSVLGTIHTCCIPNLRIAYHFELSSLPKGVFILHTEISLPTTAGDYMYRILLNRIFALSL
jgi:hypothetical protein